MLELLMQANLLILHEGIHTEVGISIKEKG